MSVVLPREVTERMASREHRHHHWLWHEVRNSWLSYPEDVRQQIRALGWEPPRPALDENRRPILDNASGEDFLYMHKQMLIDVSRMLTRLNDPAYPGVLVWRKVPPPGDPLFPVPPPWFDPERGDEVDRRSFFEMIKRLKSDIFYEKRMVSWQRLFTDPGWLRDVTLGELGALVEQTIHAAMHNRWSASPAGFRPDPGPAQGHTIDPIWDDPRYNFLGDTYSSHVNPVFWSLHAWVDDRIEDWKAANGVFGNGFWKGTWVGKMPRIDAPMGERPPEEQPAPIQPAPSHPHAAPHRTAAHPRVLEGEDPDAMNPGPHALIHDASHQHDDLEEMQEVVRLIGQCGIFHGGYRRDISYLVQ